MTGGGPIAQTVSMALFGWPGLQRTHHICKHLLHLSPIPRDKTKVSQDSGVSEACAAACGSLS